MTAILFILLSLLVSFFVVMPIIQAKTRKGKLSSIQSNHRASDLEERKESIYAAIKDIEFDYQMGKLSEEDFNELRQQYKDEAINLLKKIDQTHMIQIGSKDIHSEKTHQKGKSAKTANFCWICGMAVNENDKFCINCGNKIVSE